MRRLPTALAVVLAAVAAGCGTATSSDQDFSGDEADVAQVVEDLEEAAREDAPRRVCNALLAPAVTEELGDGCERAVERAFDDADSTALTVADVTVTGDRARARVLTGRDEEAEETLEFARAGEDWQIAAFGGAG